MARKKQTQKRRIETCSSHRERVLYHYHRVMPNRTSHRILIWVGFFVISAIIAIQLLYPVAVSRPFTFIDKRQAGIQGEIDLTTTLMRQFETSTLSISIEGGATKTYTLAETGAQFDADRVAAQIIDYPLWARFIPLSLLVPVNYGNNDGIYFSQAVLNTFAQKVAAELSYSAKNARLEIINGTLRAEGESSGRTIEPKAFADQVSAKTIQLGEETKLVAVTKELPAQKTAADISSVRMQAEAALATTPVFMYAGERVQPTKEEVASWLIINEKDGKTTLSVDESVVKKYFETLDQKYGIQPGQTNITLSNGRETSRQVGRSGHGIDEAAMLPRLSEWLLVKRDSVVIELSLKDAPASIVYNNAYSASQEGLRAYVKDMAKKYQANIVVHQLEGEKWTAEDSAMYSTPSASTYKLFVALRLFDELDKGATSWNAPMLDTTVSGCFNRMTIASTNPCATEWLSQYGRLNMNNYVYQHGFSTGTTFTDPEAVHTTAADLTKFMTGLYDGSLVSGANRERLLKSLSTHPYRSGIPAGSAGKVYDKVGFLWDYVHDTAIVIHPQGTYILTIMTKGQSYARIAMITREIEKIMYP